MLSDEKLEYIEKKFHEKSINIKTQDYIIRYIELNDKLFGNIINIDILINRLLTNLNYNISSLDPQENILATLYRTARTKGLYDSQNKKILLSPFRKLQSMLSSNKKARLNSTIMHELDHCATTKYIKISKVQKEDDIQTFLRNNNIHDEKEKSDFINFVNQTYEKYNGFLGIVGIDNPRDVLFNKPPLKRLNEGITSYKQELYDIYLGNKPRTTYQEEKKAAKFIADVIGKNNLIQMHFNNDYQSIRTAFNQKTNENLDDLVTILNQKSKFKAKIFGRIYNKIYSKKVDTFIKKASENIKNKSQVERTSFVSKYNIDHTIVKNLEEKSHQQEHKLANKDSADISL